MTADLKRWDKKWCLHVCIVGIIICSPKQVMGNVDQTPCQLGYEDITKNGCKCEESYGDCSSGPRYGEDPSFKCQLDKYDNKWKADLASRNTTDCTYQNCSSSLIVKLNLVKNHRVDPYMEELPILNITFTVPQAFVSDNSNFHPGAVLVNVSYHAKVRDIYPRFPRVFNFSQSDSTSFDKKQGDGLYIEVDWYTNGIIGDTKNGLCDQVVFIYRWSLEQLRTISFPCIYGFRKSEDKSQHTVYVIELKTYSKLRVRNMDQQNILFTALQYNITMYNYYAHNVNEWKTTIAVAKYPTPYDVYVVFDPAPEKYKVTNYKVILVNTELPADRNFSQKSVKHDSKSYSVIFKNVTDGTFKVKIDVTGDNCQGSCKEHMSHNIVMNNYKKVEEDGTKIPVDNSVFIWPVLGGVLAISLLIIVFLYHRKHRLSMENSARTVHSLLLYSNAENANCKVAACFVKFLREKLNMHVTYDMDEQAKVVQDISGWYTRKLQGVDHVIVLWSPGANAVTANVVNRDSAIQNYFKYAVMKAQCLKDSDSSLLRLSCVFFDYTNKKSIDSEYKQHFKLFRLYQNFEEFYRYVNQKSPPGAVRKFMKKKEYERSDLHSSVLEAVEFYKNGHRENNAHPEDPQKPVEVLFEKMSPVITRKNNDECYNEYYDENGLHWSITNCPVHGVQRVKTTGRNTGNLTVDKVDEDLLDELQNLNKSSLNSPTLLPKHSDAYFQRGQDCFDIPSDSDFKSHIFHYQNIKDVERGRVQGVHEIGDMGMQYQDDNRTHYTSRSSHHHAGFFPLVQYGRFIDEQSNDHNNDHCKMKFLPENDRQNSRTCKPEAVPLLTPEVSDDDNDSVRNTCSREVTPDSDQIKYSREITHDSDHKKCSREVTNHESFSVSSNENTNVTKNLPLSRCDSLQNGMTSDDSYECESNYSSELDNNSQGVQTDEDLIKGLLELNEF